MTNPTNKGLTENILPLVTGYELTETETLELLEEVEGKTDKGKMFNYSNKYTNQMLIFALLTLVPHYPTNVWCMCSIRFQLK